MTASKQARQNAAFASAKPGETQTFADTVMEMWNLLEEAWLSYRARDDARHALAVQEVAAFVNRVDAHKVYGAAEDASASTWAALRAAAAAKPDAPVAEVLALLDRLHEAGRSLSS